MKIRKSRRQKFPIRAGEPELVNIWFKNFKAFGDWVKIPIKPITVIFGKNSAGKSSIMHAFLWLREISENGFLDIRTTAKSGDFVDLGGLQNYVHTNQKGAAKTVAYKVELLDSRGSRPYLNTELKMLFYRFYEKLPSWIDLTNNLDQEKIEQAQITLNQTKAEDKLCKFLGSQNKIEFIVEFELQGDGGTEEVESGEIQPTITIKVNDNAFCILKPKLQVKETDEEDVRIEDIKYEFKFSDDFSAAILSEVSRIMEIIYPNDHFGHKNSFHSPIALRLLLKDIERDSVWTDWNENFSGLKIYPSRRFSGSKYTDIDDKKDKALFSEETSPIKRFNENVFPILRLLMEEVYLAWIKKILELKKHSLGSLLEKLNYLPAVREYPERVLSENNIFTSYGKEIYGNKSYRSLFRSTKLIKDLNLACRSLGAKFEFKVVKRYVQLLGRSLVIKNSFNQKEISFRDIGFGWSQVFPVLVEILSKDSPLILVEQPELHLHPSAQSQLMLIIIDQILESQMRQEKTRPFSLFQILEPNQKIILEAHSEQMVIKMLSCFKKYSIREKKHEISLGPHSCSILYVNSDGASSSIKEIIPDENGNIGNQWPGGFFESAMFDLVQKPKENLKS